MESGQLSRSDKYFLKLECQVEHCGLSFLTRASPCLTLPRGSWPTQERSCVRRGMRRWLFVKHKQQQVPCNHFHYICCKITVKNFHSKTFSAYLSLRNNTRRSRSPASLQFIYLHSYCNRDPCQLYCDTVFVERRNIDCICVETKSSFSRMILFLLEVACFVLHNIF